MTFRVLSIAACAAIPLALSACAGPEGDPPSLAARPIERIMDEPMRGIAPVVSASDAALVSRIDGLISQAQTGQSAFAAALPRTQNAVSGAGGFESESWINAQLALSALDSARSPTTTALGDLDAILAEQTAMGQPVEVDHLTAARDRVATLYAGQAEAYQALVGALARR